MSVSAARAKDQIDTYRKWILAVLLGVAIVLGGGGSPNPLTEVLVQLAAVLAIACWIWLPGNYLIGSGSPASRKAGIIATALVAVPVIQLIPLPPSIWQGLPGREGAVGALSLVGEQGGWRPLSLAPGQTMAGLLALVPPVFVLLAIPRLSPDARLFAVKAVLLAIFAGVVLGGLQVAMGNQAPVLYQASNRGWLTGFQANRNAQADVVLCGMILLALVAATRAGAGMDTGARGGRGSGPRLADHTLLGLAAIFLLGCAVVLTGSRMGIAMLPVALLGAFILLRRQLPQGKPLHLILPGAALVAAAAVGLASLASAASGLGRIAQRFAVSGDFRTELWEDTWFAIGQYWPAGFGLGGFRAAMLPAERLEVLDPTLPNRAHNEYLEMLLEGGVLSVVQVVVIATVLATAVVPGLHMAQGRGIARSHLVAGLAVLAILAVHSVVDYPLRSMSLACIAALATGLVLAAAAASAPAGGQVLQGDAREPSNS